jgi:tRNA threonylcarbamoyladenosine biosynthesis protein TsaB
MDEVAVGSTAAAAGVLVHLETATPLCGVAVADAATGALLWHRAERAETGFLHAERLHVLLEEAFAAFPRSLWRAVSVSDGPGSYTGLRIGAASAKGLCAALELPLVAVPTLESLAVGALASTGDSPYSDASPLADAVPTSERRIFAAVDARRLEVYGAFFAPNGARLTEDEPWIFPDRVADWGTEPLVAVGDGAAKLEPWFPEGSQCLGELPPERWLAGSVRVACARLAEGRVEDLGRYAPNYLKEAAARKASQSV